MKMTNPNLCTPWSKQNIQAPHHPSIQTTSPPLWMIFQIWLKLNQTSMTIFTCLIETVLMWAITSLYLSSKLKKLSLMMKTLKRTGKWRRKSQLITTCYKRQSEETKENIRAQMTQNQMRNGNQRRQNNLEGSNPLQDESQSADLHPRDQFLKEDPQEQNWK